MDDRAAIIAYIDSVAAYLRRRAKTAVDTQHPEALIWAASWIDRAETAERINALIKAGDPQMPEFWTDYGEHLQAAAFSR